MIQVPTFGLNVYGRSPLPLLIVGLLLGFCCPFLFGQEVKPEADSKGIVAKDPYTFMERPSADGIGKVYLGREISHVMGHRGAEWLERPERDVEEHPDRLIEALNLEIGDHVADIGAGTGYFTWRLAKAVGETGNVYAVDIQPEMLQRLNSKMKSLGIRNYLPIEGTITDPKLPKEALDLVLMVDVYHEFSHPFEMLTAIHGSIKQGGRLVFVEYRLEDPEVPIKRLHKMSEAQVILEAKSVGFHHIKTDARLPRQHILVFERP